METDRYLFFVESKRVDHQERWNGVVLRNKADKILPFEDSCFSGLIGVIECASAVYEVTTALASTKATAY